MRNDPNAALLTAAMLAACLAATVTFGDSVFHDKPASPRSLPADNLPPFGMLDEQGRLVPVPPMPAGGLHRGPGSPPESTAAGPNLADSIAAARAAVAACSAAGYRIGATVIDSSGEARAMLTADGSDGSHVFVAMRKAITALTFKMPSAQVRALVEKDKAQLARVTPAMFVEGGAVPITADGKVIGAIGASGAGGSPIGHQDESCAIAGLNAIRAQSK
ncbi:MAG TPA: heme-binding protein [Steroidobacteraceae bacterium]